ncbi:hypothetical protein FKP32DRAFT_1676218 [Trametes sanguinea]|nr:hypothetical protein FKP32DRAFT_1676218 [Trametes sanguinea]
MIQPPSPVTIHITYTQQKAVDLPTDEGQPLSTASVILRHRHLRQQHGAASMQQTTQGPPGRPTKGVTVSLGGPLALDTSHVQPTSAVPETGVRHIEAAIPIATTGSGAPAQLATSSTTSPGRNKPVTSGRPFLIEPVRAGQPAAVSGAEAPGNVPPAAGTSAEDIRRGTVGASILPEISVDGENYQVSLKGHAIRSTREKTIWFESSGRKLLSAPLPVRTPRFGDLYVHSTPDAKQMWLRTAEQEWMKIDLYHPHPWLPGYKIHFIANGEPRWVTQDSLRTYQTRREKRRRELEAAAEKANGSEALPRQVLHGGEPPKGSQCQYPFVPFSDTR